MLPKPYHDLQALIREADAFCDLLAPVKSVISLVPLHHVFGFMFGILYPERCGASNTDAHFCPPISVLRKLQSGSLVVATPYLWQLLAETAQPMPPGLVGVTSGATMPRALWRKLLDLGVDTLTEVYGSTETAGIAWRQSPGAPFQLLPYLQRSASDVLSPDASAPLEIQDHLTWVDDRNFHLEGRIDRAVQVAGVNVSPSKVAGVLKASELVQDAIVRLEGERLKAYVVPADPGCNATDLNNDLERIACDQLPAPARPMKYTFGAALPRNAMGKLSDWE